jgi:hypothetical protein
MSASMRLTMGSAFVFLIIWLLIQIDFASKAGVRAGFL